MEIRGARAERRSAAAARTRRGLSWKAWAQDLDEHLHAIEKLFWPNLFILGGGVCKSADKFIPRLTVRGPVVAGAAAQRRRHRRARRSLADGAAGRASGHGADRAPPDDRRGANRPARPGGTLGPAARWAEDDGVPDDLARLIALAALADRADRAAAISSSTSARRWSLALLGGAIAVRLRQPAIVGLPRWPASSIGPFTPGFVGDVGADRDAGRGRRRPAAVRAGRGVLAPRAASRAPGGRARARSLQIARSAAVGAIAADRRSGSTCGRRSWSGPACRSRRRSS